MRKFLVIAALLLVPLMAFAAENLHQKGNGGAVWVQSKDATTFPTGGPINVEIQDITSAVTKYVYAYKTGNIMKVYSVLGAAITGNDAITVMSNHSGSFAATGHTLTLTASGSAAGTIDSSVLTAPTTATHVDQGDVIAVVSDGNSSGGSYVNFTIVIE